MATCSDDDVVIMLRLLLIFVVLGPVVDDNIIRLLIAKPVVISGRVAINNRHEHAIMMGES